MSETEHVSISEPVAADWLALTAALTTVVLWASAFVGIRAVADDLSPGALAVGRLLVGSVALGVVVALRRPVWPSRRDLARIAAVGIVWFGAYNVALNAAEQLVDAGTAAMLVNVGPILIALFAGLFLGEGFPPRLVAGSAIAFGGAIVIGLATGGGEADAAARFSTAAFDGFVVNDGGEIRALSSVCTHMGCSLQYRPEWQDLRCPCHGASFDLGGRLANGRRTWRQNPYRGDAQAYPIQLPDLVRPRVKVADGAILVWTAQA